MRYLLDDVKVDVLSIIISLYFLQTTRPVCCWPCAFHKRTLLRTFTDQIEPYGALQET